jgi:hypothetical protein
MLSRFSLAFLFAVLVATSRPIATGGARDLLAVGVLVEETVEGKPTRRIAALGMPEGAAREAYETLLRTAAGEALFLGTTVYAPAQGEPGPEPRIVGLVYYGSGSRAGRAPVVFTGPREVALPGAAEAWKVAQSLGAAPGPVTAAAAKVLLGTEDLASYRDALEALSTVEADAASAEAVGTAADASAPLPRRVVAIQVLKRMGGARLYPALFRRLAQDPEAVIRDAAK